MSTIGEHLDAMPEPYRSLALANVGRQKPVESLRRPAADRWLAVTAAFNWERTPEGVDFWYCVGKGMSPAVPGGPGMNRITIDLSGRFTPEEAAGIDRAAVRAGTTPESIAEAAAVRALKRATASRAEFRLRMPDDARKKLQMHASALGCDAAALALFLLRRRQAESVSLSG